MPIMKNINYDLIKLLHCKMDTVWRLEKFYCSDAQQEQCASEPILQQILKQEKQQVQLLIEHIKKRMNAGLFD